MINVSGIKRITLGRERYVLCRPVVVLVTNVEHLLCLFDQPISSFLRCYKNLFHEKISPLSLNRTAYRAVNMSRTRRLFFSFPFSVDSISCGVARDESHVISKKTCVSTTSPRYLYNDISCLDLIDIFKISRQKYITTQRYLCSSKKLIKDCAFSGTCSKYVTETFFELWKRRRRKNGIFMTPRRFLKASIYVLYIQYF